MRLANGKLDLKALVGALYELLGEEYAGCFRVNEKAHILEAAVAIESLSHYPFHEGEKESQLRAPTSNLSGYIGHSLIGCVQKEKLEDVMEWAKKQSFLNPEFCFYVSKVVAQVWTPKPVIQKTRISIF